MRLKKILIAVLGAILFSVNSWGQHGEYRDVITVTTLDPIDLKDYVTPPGQSIPPPVLIRIVVDLVDPSQVLMGASNLNNVVWGLPSNHPSPTSSAWVPPSVPGISYVINGDEGGVNLRVNHISWPVLEKNGESVARLTEDDNGTFYGVPGDVYTLQTAIASSRLYHSETVEVGRNQSVYETPQITNSYRFASSDGITTNPFNEKRLRIEYSNPTFIYVASAGSGGTISPSGSVTITQGQNQTFTATPSAGKEVDEWKVNGVTVATSGTSYEVTNVQTNGTISVSFKDTAPTTFTYVASAGSGGTISPSGSVTITQGQNQTFTATPSAGKEVDEWKVNGTTVATSGISYEVTNVQENGTISVSFKDIVPTTYTVSVSANNSNYGTVSGGGSIEEGETTTVTATPESGYQFVNWTEGGTEVSTSASYAFSVNSDRTLVANFEAIPPPPVTTIVTMTTTANEVSLSTRWDGSGEIRANGVLLNKNSQSSNTITPDESGEITLTATGDAQLTYLHCNNAQLTSLDVTKCLDLDVLSCYNNQLTELNLTNCTALNYLDCYSNQLTVLDVTNCSSLRTFSASNQTIALPTATATGGSLTISNPISYNQSPLISITGATASGSDITWSGLTGTSGTATYTFAGRTPASVAVGAPFSGTVSQPWTDESSDINVSEVSLNATSLSMNIGDQEQLTATINPTDATDQTVNWDSSNTDVATVSSTGVVTAIAPGTATITVTTNDGGFTATCAVVVNQSVVVEEGKTVGSDGTGSLDFSLSIPADATITGTFEIKLPEGYTLDESATKLVESLAGLFDLVITFKGNGVWQIEIKSNGLKAVSGASLTKIMLIAYAVNPAVPMGTYNIELSNFDLKLSDGTSVQETNIVVPTKVERYGTGKEDLHASAPQIWAAQGQIYVNLPESANVQVISVSGIVLYNKNLPLGTHNISLNSGIYVVKAGNVTQKVRLNP